MTIRRGRNSVDPIIKTLNRGRGNLSPIFKERKMSEQITLKEAAEILGVAKQTARGFVTTGGLTDLREEGDTQGTLMVSRAEVEALKEKRNNPPVAAPPIEPIPLEAVEAKVEPVEVPLEAVEAKVEPVEVPLEAVEAKVEPVEVPPEVPDADERTPAEKLVDLEKEAARIRVDNAVDLKRDEEMAEAKIIQGNIDRMNSEYDKLRKRRDALKKESEKSLIEAKEATEFLARVNRDNRGRQTEVENLNIKLGSINRKRERTRVKNLGILARLEEEV